jgi:hypothetical protein
MIPKNDPLNEPVTFSVAFTRAVTTMMDSVGGAETKTTVLPEIV